MKMRYLWTLILGSCLGSNLASGQTKAPANEVNSAFSKMFPNANKVEWQEKVNNFTAYFTLKDKKCEAKFKKNGEWLSTEQSLLWDSLPHTVLDSFRLSKYADWNKSSAYSLQSSEGPTQYHVVVTKDDLGRKILIFSPDGKLITSH